MTKRTNVRAHIIHTHIEFLIRACVCAKIQMNIALVWCRFYFQFVANSWRRHIMKCDRCLRVTPTIISFTFIWNYIRLWAKYRQTSIACAICQYFTIVEYLKCSIQIRSQDNRVHLSINLWKNELFKVIHDQEKIESKSRYWTWKTRKSQK